MCAVQYLKTLPIVYCYDEGICMKFKMFAPALFAANCLFIGIAWANAPSDTSTFFGFSAETWRWGLGIALGGAGGLSLWILNGIKEHLSSLNSKVTFVLNRVQKNDDAIQAINATIGRIPCVRQGFKCPDKEEE